MMLLFFRPNPPVSLAVTKMPAPLRLRSTSSSQCAEREPGTPRSVPPGIADHSRGAHHKHLPEIAVTGIRDAAKPVFPSA